MTLQEALKNSRGAVADLGDGPILAIQHTTMGLLVFAFPAGWDLSKGVPPIGELKMLSNLVPDGIDWQPFQLIS